MVSTDQFKVLIAYPNLSMMLTPSYAVALFTAILREQGYQVELFDCTPYLSTYEFHKEPLPVTRANKLLNSRKFDAQSLFGDPKADLVGDFERMLDTFDPNVVVVSTLVEDTWPQAKELLDLLAEKPLIQSIVGGVFTTMAPDVVIADPSVQCIGIGEGEETVVEFCERVRLGHDTTDIAGTWAKSSDGTIVRNPSRPLVELNQVVPDFSLFDERRFMRPLGAKIWKTIPLETYRGCPYTCTFCNSPTQVKLAKDNGQGRFYRRKSLSSVRLEIQTMIERYDPTFFYINDDAFMARPKSEQMAFADMYEEFKIPFWFQTRLRM